MHIIDGYGRAFVQFVTPYYERNDSGHQLKHALDVLDNAMMFKTVLDLNVPEKEIIAATLMHDIQLYRGRKNHHVNGANFATTNDYPGKSEFSHDAQERIAMAILQHRASFTGSYTAQLSELVSSADRGIPSTYQELLDRIRGCKIDIVTDAGELKSADEIEQMAVSHLKEKFGTAGYARYPDMYIEMYMDRLSKRAAEIDKL